VSLILVQLWLNVELLHRGDNGFGAFDKILEDGGSVIV
jgi:hypothetical protein